MLAKGCTNSNSFTSFSVLWFIRKQAKVVYMHLTMKLVSINLFILHNLYSSHSWILNFFIPVPDYLRTKYAPEIEESEQKVETMATNIPPDEAQVYRN